VTAGFLGQPAEAGGSEFQGYLLRINRYLTHAFVLAIALAISGYASFDRHAGSYLSQLGPVNAQALVDQGGAVGDVTFGRFSTIIKPLAIPMAAPLSHSPSFYTVQAGDSLASIAAKFRVTASDLRWSNGGLFSSGATRPGQQLVVPPVPGVVVTVRAGDTLQSLATAYRVDPATIADFNRFRDMPLAAGTIVVIPGGVGPDFPAPARASASARVSTGYIAFYGSFHLTIGAPVGHYPATGFPWGWCTWYVATRRPVPWRGNAIEWYANAARMGFPVGAQPRAGAIMVDRESPIGLGHVAYVETVYPDGSWLISEMDYGMFGVTDQRTIHPGQLNGLLVGFIYG
jgi:LysM repeat protein